jgi:hypothetical protein
MSTPYQELGFIFFSRINREVRILWIFVFHDTFIIPTCLKIHARNKIYICAFYSKLITHINNGVNPLGVFCDLTRAFESVDFDTMLGKLKHYAIAIGDTTIDCFVFLLKDRKSFKRVIGIIKKSR